MTKPLRPWDRFVLPDAAREAVSNVGLGPLPPHRKVTVHGRMWTEEDMRAYAIQERAAERERCAQYLRDAAYRLDPGRGRVNSVDRHTAHVLACKAEELARL